MKLRICLIPALMLLLPGCIYVRDATHRASRSGVRSQSRPECHPSEYWDGDQCRHKGKGRGARKHDH
jgi:hypothetical protein